jgi:hypothetical protein
MNKVDNGAQGSTSRRDMRRVRSMGTARRPRAGRPRSPAIHRRFARQQLANYLPCHLAVCMCRSRHLHSLSRSTGSRSARSNHGASHWTPPMMTSTMRLVGGNSRRRSGCATMCTIACLLVLLLASCCTLSAELTIPTCSADRSAEHQPDACGVSATPTPKGTAAEEAHAAGTRELEQLVAKSDVSEGHARTQSGELTSWRC